MHRENGKLKASERECSLISLLSIFTLFMNAHFYSSTNEFVCVRMLFCHLKYVKCSVNLNAQHGNVIFNRLEYFNGVLVKNKNSCNSWQLSTPICYYHEAVRLSISGHRIYARCARFEICFTISFLFFKFHTHSCHQRKSDAYSIVLCAINDRCCFVLLCFFFEEEQKPYSEIAGAI